MLSIMLVDAHVLPSLWRDRVYHNEALMHKLLQQDAVAKQSFALVFTLCSAHHTKELPQC